MEPEGLQNFLKLFQFVLQILGREGGREGDRGKRREMTIIPYYVARGGGG